MEISYSQVGDYYLPDLTLEKHPSYGKYGMLRKSYLQEYRKGVYSALILSGKLNEHLADIDNTVRQFVFRVVKELAQEKGIDEQLKATNQLEWVSEMNSIKSQTEEIAFNEFIYC